MSKGKDYGTWCCIPYELTEAQRLIAESKKIIRMASTGIRFGKTFLAGHVLADYAWNNPGSVSWYIMPYNVMGKNFSYWVDKYICRDACRDYDLVRGIINFKNGAAIKMASAYNPSEIRGCNTGLMVLDDCCFMDKDVYRILKDLEFDNEHRILLLSTPERNNWFCRMFHELKSNPDADLFVFSSDYGVLDEREIYILKDGIPEDYREVEFMGVPVYDVEPSVDMVSHPSHYNQTDLECWDVYIDLLKHKNMPGHLAALWSNIFKYVWRCGDKEGKMVEDMQKVLECAAKFIEVAEGNSERRVDS